MISNPPDATTVVMLILLSIAGAIVFQLGVMGCTEYEPEAISMETEPQL